MEFNPDEVITDQHMVFHLWDANCSVCSKIVGRFRDLSDFAQANPELFLKFLNARTPSPSTIPTEVQNAG